MNAKSNSTLSVRLNASFLALVWSGVLALAATNPPAMDTAAALLRLQAQLDEQTSRLDRLYDAIGPQLNEPGNANIFGAGGGPEREVRTVARTVPAVNRPKSAVKPKTPIPSE